MSCELKFALRISQLGVGLGGSSLNYVAREKIFDDYPRIKMDKNLTSNYSNYLRKILEEPFV